MLRSTYFYHQPIVLLGVLSELPSTQAAEHFAAESEIIVRLINSAKTVELITRNFGKRGRGFGIMASRNSVSLRGVN